MALLSEAMKQKETDIRMIQRGLSKGLIIQSEVEKIKKELQDDSENVATANIDDLMAEVKSRKTGLR